MSSARLTSLVAAAVTAAALLGACADPLASRPETALTPRYEDNVGGISVPSQPTPNQYVVLFKAGHSELASESSAGGGVEHGRLVYANGAVYDNITDRTLLAADANVAAVQENLLVYPTAVVATGFPTGATFYRRGWQWNMKQIRADSVPATVTGAGTKVCIIDTGIDGTHQDLVGKVVAAQSFVDAAHGYSGAASPPLLDSAGHGSHVASTVTSNGIGVGSVAPGASLIAAKVFAATGGATTAAIDDAITYCAQQNADVINMSLGGTRARPLTAGGLQDSIGYATVITAARNAGTVVVASAGNDNKELDATKPALSYTFPAQIAGVVTVGATGPTNTTYPFPAGSLPGSNFDARASYSNYGADVDVYAPGGVAFVNAIQSNITAACSSMIVGGNCVGGKQYLTISGTSMASPHVAGIAALITGRTTAARGLARSQAVENCIYSTGDNITITVSAVSNVRPRINALKAATAACAGI